MRRTRGKGHSVPYIRFEKLWSGIGLNYLDLRQEVIDDLISLLIGFSTYKYLVFNSLSPLVIAIYALSPQLHYSAFFVVWPNWNVISWKY